MRTPLAGLRIVLADDHAVVRMGFRMLLEAAGATVVAEADSRKDALRQCAEHAPDVLVLDVSMPRADGIMATWRLLARDPHARVLVVSAHDDAMIPVRALQAGALGYLCKRCQPEELVRATLRVARRQRYLDPGLAEQVALAQLESTANPAEVLTAKEFTVFLQLARGRSVRRIADDLHLSPSTIGTHLYHVKQKLRAANSAELAVIAIRAGLIDP